MRVLTVEDITRMCPWHEIDDSFFIPLRSLLTSSPLFRAIQYPEGVRVYFINGGFCWAVAKVFYARPEAFVSLEFLATCALSHFTLYMRSEDVDSYQLLRDTLLQGLKISIIRANHFL